MAEMRSPYVPHLFAEQAAEKLQNRRGWLTVGVASSIPWPQEDVWLEYDHSEYLLRGVRKKGEHTTTPCISTPCPSNEQSDDALSRLYRFVSILGYFKRGYVDIVGVTWATYPIFHVTPNQLIGVTLEGSKYFNCNHLPIIENDQVSKALAFLREGRRLRRVHDPYSFLSFFKVIESQFESPDRVAWIEQNLGQLGGTAGTRIAELRAQGVDVNRHLYESGRSAVAHASLTGVIVDPDVPADRKRIVADLDVIEALATRYVKIDAGVPDEMDLYEKRDRTAPWHPLMRPTAVEALKGGGKVTDPADLGTLEGTRVSIKLWPDPPAGQFHAMTLLPVESGGGALKLIALNERETILLAFSMDVRKGRMHALLNEGWCRDCNDTTEQDIEDYTRYFHSVIANRIVELGIAGAQPVDCDVVIPVNIIPRPPEEAVAQALEQFRRAKAKSVGPPASHE
jgi:hypothetical protein